jgi:hypothetical protein
VITPAWHDFIRLWAACRSETGIAHWPDPGGVGDQAAWVVDAFSALASFHAAMNEAEQKQRRQG